MSAPVNGIATQAPPHTATAETRHTFGETAADLDVARGVLQRLLGQRTVAAQDVYRRVPVAKVIDGATAITSRLMDDPGR
ncbi:MAG: hypothetical protein M3083_09185 [Actinomycetota bacterium]|nr:hypothetical protein [Actinomycetota bacterium]